MGRRERENSEEGRGKTTGEEEGEKGRRGIGWRSPVQVELEPSPCLAAIAGGSCCWPDRRRSHRLTLPSSVAASPASSEKVCVCAPVFFRRPSPIVNRRSPSVHLCTLPSLLFRRHAVVAASQSGDPARRRR
ncbi:hypothetical protein MRB53_003775 [Persea americana]|uniref:Uncharacterized protein n=1 Tax=Persea americana TaxID=3435 RepID=A0ACC2MYA6_PERAE|nr:hypothetical protein MRB53_003775 [Persea americana]